jgi:ankyrin repeat protein
LPVDDDLSVNGQIRAANQQAEIIRFLLSLDPEAASRATTESSHLPLHLACDSDNINLDAVEVLFNSYPEAIYSTDRDGRIPLDIARGQDSGNTQVLQYLERQGAYAEQARNPIVMNTPLYNRGNWLPLHQALRENASIGAIKLLVKGNPNALMVAVQWGAYPLHIACAFASADVVRYLVELDDRCLHICDVHEDSTLHYACRKGNCGVVNYLLDRCVPSVSKRNRDGKLPIHLLCEAAKGLKEGGNQPPAYTETIWSLLLAYPETVLF